MCAQCLEVLPFWAEMVLFDMAVALACRCRRCILTLVKNGLITLKFLKAGTIRRVTFFVTVAAICSQEELLLCGLQIWWGHESITHVITSLALLSLALLSLILLVLVCVRIDSCQSKKGHKSYVISPVYLSIYLYLFTFL
jgi:hypothetical protein